MALVHWQPTDLFDLRRDMNRLFAPWGTDPQSNGSEPEPSRQAVWRPVVDIGETSDEYLVTADLPGVDRDNIEVTVVDGRLTIRGERHQQTKADDGTVHRVERIFGTFSRSFDLPTAVNAENITAVYSDGVLTVSVPKAEEAKPKQIEIKVKAA